MPQPWRRTPAFASLPDACALRAQTWEREVGIEYADEEVSDSVVFDDAIMDARRWRSRKLMRLGAAALVDAHVRAAEASEEGGSAAGGVSASRRALDSWLPTEEDLAATELDPDLPVTGAWAVRVGWGEPHALLP